MCVIQAESPLLPEKGKCHLGMVGKQNTLPDLGFGEGDHIVHPRKQDVLRMQGDTHHRDAGTAGVKPGRPGKPGKMVPRIQERFQGGSVCPCTAVCPGGGLLHGIPMAAGPGAVCSWPHLAVSLFSPRHHMLFPARNSVCSILPAWNALLTLPPILRIPLGVS